MGSPLAKEQGGRQPVATGDTQVLRERYQKAEASSTGSGKVILCGSLGTVSHRTYQRARGTHCCTGCTRDECCPVRASTGPLRLSSFPSRLRRRSSWSFYHAPCMPSWHPGLFPAHIRKRRD